jgi:hypothetical protein
MTRSHLPGSALRLTLALAISTGALLMTSASPGAALAAVSPHTRIPVDTHQRGHVPAGPWASSNWSGYAITGRKGSFTSVTAAWTVPSVSPSSGDTYSSNWVGIDGFNDSSLIQAGTESDYVGGAASYDAWWEILPAAETVVFSVSPGDAMTATVSRNPSGTWTITITDTRSHVTSSTTHTYRGQLTSAEWIEEAPSVNGGTAALADYGAATFDPGTVNGHSAGLTTSEAGVMVQGGVQVSTPSTPDRDVDGFNIAYGATAPNPPSS